MTAKLGNDLQGMSRTKIYRAWDGMIKRCYNPKYSLYHRYGGRGISVCDRWRNSLSLFLLDMGEPPTDQSSLDRYPDNNWNYEPGNCRWATPTEQSNNRSTNIAYTINGVTKNLKEWAEDVGINYKALYNRVKKLGWGIEKSIREPIADSKFRTGGAKSFYRRVVDVDGKEFSSVSEAARFYGIAYTTLISQINGVHPNKTKLRYL